MKPDVIEIHNLRKEYPGFTLDDVSFSLPGGYIMGLIGPNGAGKTTLIKLIMNLVRRQGGQIRLFGLCNLAHEAEVKARIGFVYDEPPFPGQFSLAAIKAAVAPFYPRWNEPAFQRLMREFGLPPGQKFKRLSHGQKLQFSLALALAHEADLLLMDEPTAGLDPAFRLELLERLAALIQDEGKSVLFSTHITADLERTADFITFIDRGRLVFTSTREALRENWVIVRGGPELLAEARVPGFQGHRASEFAVEVLSSDADRARAVVPPGCVLEPASLEDIMYFKTLGGSHA